MNFEFNGRKIIKGDTFVWRDDKKTIYKIENIYKEYIEFSWIYKNRKVFDRRYPKLNLISALVRGTCKFYEIKIYRTKLSEKLYPNVIKENNFLIIKGE